MRQNWKVWLGGRYNLAELYIALLVSPLPICHLSGFLYIGSMTGPLFCLVLVGRGLSAGDCNSFVPYFYCHEYLDLNIKIGRRVQEAQKEII